MSKIEEVLVIERHVIEKLGLFQGLSFKVNHYLDGFWRGEGVSFMARPEAENNPEFKQIIPYIIMTYKDKYLCYTRGIGVDEKRLAQKTSIGIGGHINPTDAINFSKNNLKNVYLNAVKREVAEEVFVNTNYKDTVIGLINDDSNEVGKVHLGVIHLWNLDEPKVTNREDEICQIRFMSIYELEQIRNCMESWSQLCLDSLKEIAKQ